MRLGLLIYGELDTLSGGYLYDRLLVRFFEARGHHVEIISLPWRSYADHLTDNWSNAFLCRLQALDVDILLQDELNHPSLAWLNRRLKPTVDYAIVSIVHHLRISERHPARVMHLYRAVEQQYLESVDGFIYNSQTTRRTVEELIDVQQSSQQPSRVVLPGATHLVLLNSVWLHESSNAKQISPLFRILFVGNLIERKGLHTLLEALAACKDIHWQLDVVGRLDADTDYVSQIRQQIVHEGLSRHVILHGKVDEKELRSFLGDAHLLAVPSYEGFGIVYLEAMAFAVPVIASRAGAAHEIVEDGVNGFLVELDDSPTLCQRISLLAADRNLWRQMSQAAYQRFAHHPSWEKSFTELEQWLASTFLS